MGKPDAGHHVELYADGWAESHNYPALKEACMELRQMLMQKTAGQRKDRLKDLSWENLERVKVTIICEAMALVLSGEYEGCKQTD